MKRGLLFCVLLVVVVIFFISNVFALGISPAIFDVDFTSGGEYEFTFSVSSDNPDQIMDLDLGGPLAKYGTLSAKEVIGSGTFNVKLKLPQEAETPGPNRIAVMVSERKPEEGFIGTRVEIRGTIIVHVPYPGRYAEADLNIGDGNVDSFIPFSLSISNKGKEDLYISSQVQIFEDNGNPVYSLSFDPFSLNAGESKNFRRLLNTTDYKPGNYLAKTIINYGNEIKIDKKFRIGYLFVNITNFTQELPNSGIQKYFIGIESRWNGDVDSVYADVNISNSTKEIIFRTPSISLPKWENGILEGYVDTTQLEGLYNAGVKLSYLGKETSAYGKLNVYRREINMFIISAIIIGIIIILLAIFIIWMIVKKRKNKSGKDRKK